MSAYSRASSRALPSPALPARALRRVLALALATMLVLGAMTTLAGPARATNGALSATGTTAAAGAAGVAQGSSTVLAAAKKNKKKLTKKQRKAKRRKAALRKARKKVRRARNVAMRQRGDRYAYGASGPHAFDCSGLVHFAFRKAGFRNVPRTSGAQAHRARRIGRRAMRPGDLMFFTGSGGVYHVGVFIGRKGGTPRMVHASRPGTPVKVDRPWTNSWFPGTMRPRGA